jgi:group II intron reverse transcriptase/maturase
MSRSSHVEVDEPDTLKRYQSREYILSRICRYISSIAFFNIHSEESCQKTRRYSSIGGSILRQATKTTWTLNGINSQLRDSTASILPTSNVLRKRSFHSSNASLNALTKGNRDNMSVSESIDIHSKELIGTTKPIVKKAVKPINVTTMVMEKLNYMNGNKFYKLLNILSDPFFLVACYEEIKGKKGNMTPGSDNYTIDGLNWNWFVNTAESLRKGTFYFSPARRIEIPKTNGKTRALGISSPRDKIVQKAMHAILEAIYEPLFLNYSHGFRPGKSIHTALRKIYISGNKYSWVIQGDIIKCFDSIPHQIIMERISKRIGDPRFLEYISKFLNAGYLDPSGKLVKSSIGTPQGGILSPLLCNIVLHQLDLFMDNFIHKFRKGVKRKGSSIYRKVGYLRKIASDSRIRRELLLKLRTLNSNDRFDPNFRRLDYIRYADDFVILVTGSIHDATHIKNNTKEFLKNNCGLELNSDKTIITNIGDNRWSFLGAEIVKLRKSPSFLRIGKIGKAVGTSRLLIKAPIDKLLDKLIKAGFLKRNTQGDIVPKMYGSVINLDHADILAFYNSKMRGLLNFYSFAANRNKLGRILWLLRASCALTLARKYKLRTMRKTYSRFGSTLKCPDSDRKIFIPDSLRVLHNYKKLINSPLPDTIINQSWAGKLTQTSFGKVCIICGTSSNIEMHHVRSVKDVRSKYLSKETVSIAKLMGAIRRKQIPLCSYHHQLYHKGELNHQDIISIYKYSD